jgi:hypothetical protein
MSGGPQVSPLIARSNEQYCKVPPQEETYPIFHTDAGATYHNEAGALFHDDTILGLRKRNFWIFVAIMSVVVCATIGGSIGGSLAVRNAR